MQTFAENNHLLAVDLGLRCGTALYGADGRLVWYRSQNLGTTPQLRQAARRMLCDASQVSWLISEGDISLAAVWERVAMRQGVRVQRVSAETWRESLLSMRAYRGSADAKKRTEDLARQVIEWSGAPAPTSLRHDAAEAILIGLYGVINLGWLRDLPVDIQQPVRRFAQMYR